jgi:hypothetical protein
MHTKVWPDVVAIKITDSGWRSFDIHGPSYYRRAQYLISMTAMARRLELDTFWKHNTA